MDFLNQLMDVESLKKFSFLYELVLILFFVKVAGHLSKKIGQPAVMGELLVGVILGPMVLGWLHQTSFITELAEIGVILLMFIAGLETDINEFKKTAYGSSLVALSGVLFPFLGGLGLGLLFNYDISTSLFIGTLLVATSVSISVQTLRELGKLQSKEGVTILGAAVLDDVLGIIILSLVVGFAAGGAGGGSALSIIILLAKILVFFFLIFVLGKYVIPRVFKWAANLITTEVVLTFGIITALGFAFMSEMFGLAGIVGAYFAGLMLSLTKFRHEVFEKVETISFSFFVPVFFVSIGLSANFGKVDSTMLFHIALLTLVAIVTKLFGGALGARLGEFNNRSSMGIGAGMIARGEVGLIVAKIGQDKGLINDELFAATIIIVLVTTLVTPPLLKAFFSKKKEANPSL